MMYCGGEFPVTVAATAWSGRSGGVAWFGEDAGDSCERRDVWPQQPLPAMTGENWSGWTIQLVGIQSSGTRHNFKAMNQSDGETFISVDDLQINLWNLEISNQSFNIVDVKPANMEDLTGQFLIFVTVASCLVL
nr:serine/threonine protein phosphatase 2A 55 kDa regulatory subunit B beta isoform-like [Ipomoea batatas]GME19065.1 serine/threonine protein phosphatase 2A 55 kDa regulatory subunit B beta isoform-like [Ipomoea batatas]